jgi:hypothetical protein
LVPAGVIPLTAATLASGVARSSDGFHQTTKNAVARPTTMARIKKPTSVCAFFKPDPQKW